MKSILATLLTLTALPAVAGELIWSGSGSERDAELKLAEPGTGRIPLKFWCVKDVDVLYVEYEFMPNLPKEGMFVDFVLSAGDLVLPTVNAVGYTTEMDKSFVLEGQMAFGEPFLAPALLGRVADRHRRGPDGDVFPGRRGGGDGAAGGDVWGEALPLNACGIGRTAQNAWGGA